MKKQKYNIYIFIIFNLYFYKDVYIWYYFIAIDAFYNYRDKIIKEEKSERIKNLAIVISFIYYKFF